MAWIYLAASAGIPWRSGNTYEQSPTVNTIDTLKPCSCRGSLTVPSTQPQSGMMFGICDARCFHGSTLSWADSHVRTLALQAAVAAWKGSEAAFIGRSIAWPKKSSPRFYSLKTSQRSALEVLTPLSGPYPSSGMTVGGRLYPLPRLGLITLEIDGSFLPTPTASSYGTNQGGGAGRVGKARPSLETMARLNLWPTPTVCGNYNQPGASPKAGMGLAHAAKLWPTVRASDGAKGGPNQSFSAGGRTLPPAVSRWPTPSARDWKETGLEPAALARKSPCLPASVRLEGESRPGSLSPLWTEWLMGFPVGWTELNALGMQWCPRRRARRSAA